MATDAAEGRRLTTASGATALEHFGATRPGERAPFGRYVAASVGLMAVATANGVTRELTYGKVIGNQAAHWVSLIPMLALFGAYVNLLERRLPLPSWRSAAVIGGAWAAIAAGFELGVGHYVDGKRWSDLLREYNLAAGRSSGLVLVATAALPTLVRAWRRRS
jgi:hypothetical protein